MDIIKHTGTTNTTPLRGRGIRYIVIHYTAGTTSRTGSARNVADMFKRGAVGGSADFIVDDGTAVQYNPDPLNRYTWAVGGNRYNTKGGSLYGVVKNSNSISIEVCSTNRTNPKAYANDPAWTFTDAVINQAVNLTKHLMKVYGIDAAHVIRHYDVTGKQCPGIVGWNADTGSEAKWQNFKRRIQDTVENPEEMDMTIDEFVSKLTTEQARLIVENANLSYDVVPEPEWSKREGYWKAATEAKVIDGTAAERPMRRDEVIAILGRLGIF